MTMHEPPHPGELVREDCLEPLQLSVTVAARALGVSRKTLSLVLNGHAGISPEMAVRLSKAFGSTPRHWLQMQMNYDLWQAEQRADQLLIERMTPERALVARMRGRAQTDLTTDEIMALSRGDSD